MSKDRKAQIPVRDGEDQGPSHYVQQEHHQYQQQHQYQHHEFVRERVISPAQSTHSQSSASASVLLEWDPSADVGIDQEKNVSSRSVATSSHSHMTRTRTEASSEVDYSDVEHAEHDIELMGNMAVAISRMLDKKSSKERLEIIKQWGMELDQLAPLYNKSRSDVKSNPDLLSRKQLSQDSDNGGVMETQKMQRSSSVASIDVSKYESKEKSQRPPSIPQIRLLKEREREKSVESFSSSSTVVGTSSKATASEKMEVEKIDHVQEDHVEVTEEQNTSKSISPALPTPINPLSDLSSSSNWQNSGLTKSELDFFRKKQDSRNQDQESMHSSNSSLNLKNTSHENSGDDYPLANSTPKSKHNGTTASGKQIVAVAPSSSKRSSKSSSSTTSSSTVWVKVHSKNDKDKYFVVAKSKGVQTGSSISEIKDRQREKTRADKYHYDLAIEARRERTSNKKQVKDNHYELQKQNRKAPESPTNIEGQNQSQRQNSISTSSSSMIWVKEKDHPSSNKGRNVSQTESKTKGIQAAKTDHSISDMEDRQREKIYKKYFDFEAEAEKERSKMNRKYEMSHHHRHHKSTKSSRGRKAFESHVNVEDQDQVSNSNSATSYATDNENEDAPSCPICEHLIDEIIRMTRCPSSQKKQKELIRAIDSHRDDHICKVRAEIQKLEILNKLISDKTSPSPSSTKASSISNSEEEDAHKSGKYSKNSHYHHHHPTDTNDGAFELKPLHKSKLKPNKASSKLISGKIEKHMTVDNKLDRLLSAFNLLTSCLVEPSDEENCEQTLTEQFYRNYKKESYKCKPSISYYVPIQKCYNSYNNEIDAELNKEMPNIQEALQANNPAFINRARERERIIARVKKERQRREELKRKWVNENLTFSNGFRRWNNCSPANLKLTPRRPAIMSAKAMKQLTKKNYRRLPEVQEKIRQKRMDRERKTNRLMSQLFTTNLRRCAIKGQLNVEHYKSLIRY